MKMPKILMSMFFFAVLLAGFAAADAQITYQFFDTSNQPVDGVTVQIYLCKDASCSSVEKLAQGTSADSGAANDFEVTYPKALMSQYGYAIYFFKDGYLPIEGTADWHGTGSTTLQKYFQKGSKCHAAISEFAVANKVEKNIPLVVSIAAQADANTYSAFGAAGIPPLYHPPEFKDLYSAATDVKFNVYDANNNQVIAEQSKSLNLFMDTAEHVSFEWTPAAAGFYKVVAKTTITDTQCDSTKYDEFAQKQTEVLADRPASMCYTLLNNLSVSKKYPVVGDNVDISVAKISNFADGSGVLSPVATNAKITVTNSSGSKVVETSWDPATSASANSNAVDAKIIAATWTPGSAGIYTITITASGSDAKCSGANKQETISQSITVKTKESEKSNVFFTIADMDVPNVFVSNAAISMGGKTATTDAGGKAAMTAMDAGTYTYTAKNKYYYDSTGTVVVGATDVHKAFTMMPKKYTLTVKVVDQNDNAVEKATVTANSVDTDAFYNSQDTNANGNAVFSKIHAGMFTVTAVKGNAMNAVSVDLDADKSVTIKLAGATNETTSTTLVITSISGTNPIEKGKVQVLTVNVKDNLNKPVNAVDVRLYYSSNNGVIGNVNTASTTDIDGNIKLAFGVDAVGDYTVYATAGKAGYTPDNDKNPTFTFTVTQATPGQNLLPYFDPALTNKNVVLGNTLTFTVNAKDNEKDAIVYSVSDLPSGASFDANTKKFTWTPVYAQLGSHKVKFKITDAVHIATGQWNEQEITITVSEPERISQKEALDMQRIDVTNEDVVAGGQFITTMTIANDELVDLDHVRIYVSIPELGVWNSIGPFQLESGEESTQTVIVDIPKNAKPGKYYIRYDVKDSKAKAQLTRDFIRIVK